jgi:hypothetical protein
LLHLAVERRSITVDQAEPGRGVGCAWREPRFANRHRVSLLRA